MHPEIDAKKYYEKHPLFNVEGVDIEFLDKIGKNIQIIDYKTKPNRYFDIFVKLNILQTNGIEINDHVLSGCVNRLTKKSCIILYSKA